MIISDPQREENFQEYLRLLKDPNYHDVTFDEKSGGVSGVHREHTFDKQLGPFGCKRGQYETDAISSLRKEGHLIILESEYPKGEGIKNCDAKLDGFPAEIKAIERIARWTIRTKITNAIKQGATVVILYYPDASLYTESSVINGWNDYLSYSNPPSQTSNAISILCVVEGQIIQIKKPSR